MCGLIMETFGVSGCMPVPSIGAVYIVCVLVFDVRNELDIFGDSQAYKYQHTFFDNKN